MSTRVIRKPSSLQKITKLISGTGAKFNPDLPAIEVKGFTKKFRNFVSTSDLNFKVGHGVIHGFIGPNGSGKTTTIKALIGAYLPTAGHLSINGYKSGTIKANRLIGYIPERASFPKHLNSIDYLTTMGEVSGLKSKVARKRALEILGSLGLEKQAKRKPITFSSGMQKKILLAQSLLTDPSVLILDEPAANLDPAARRELFNELIALRDQGKSIFISSHVLAELERIVDEITFIYFGEVLYSGDVSKFNAKTDSLFIRTTNNQLVVDYLNANNYKWDGDIRTEIEVIGINQTQADKMLKDLAMQKGIQVQMYRNNDLQTSYEKLAYEAERRRKGKQTLKGKSVLSDRNKRKHKEVSDGNL